MHRDNKCLKVADWMAGHSEILFLRKMRRWVKANNKYLPEWQFCQGKELPTCYVRQIWEFWNFFRKTTLPCNQQHICPFRQKKSFWKPFLVFLDAQTSLVPTPGRSVRPSCFRISILSAPLSPHKASIQHCGGWHGGPHDGRHGGGQGGRHGAQQKINK